MLKNQKKKKNQPKKYLLLSSLAIQMGAIIFFGTYFGSKLDVKTETKQPIFTIVGALGSIFLSTYYVLKKNK